MGPIKFLFRNILWRTQLELRMLSPTHPPQGGRNQLYISLLIKSQARHASHRLARAKGSQGTLICVLQRRPFFQETELSLPWGWSPRPGCSLWALQHPALPSSTEVPHASHHTSHRHLLLCRMAFNSLNAPRQGLLEFPRDSSYLGQLFPSPGSQQNALGPLCAWPAPLTLIMLYRDFSYLVRKISRMSSMSSSLRETMMRIRVLSRVPRPWKTSGFGGAGS